MRLVLLSGGSGKRLWPLSNDSRSKQFLRVLRNDAGQFESMVQRVWRQLSDVNLVDKSVVATSNSQMEMLQNQLGNNVPLIVEPERRDTFPAIALAATYLYSIEGVSLNEVVSVLPVDPYVEDSFFERVKELESVIQESGANIALMGVNPTYPSEKYGYIVPFNALEERDYFKVSHFMEKPNEEKAKQLIEQKALWNCGVFSFKLDYLINLLLDKGLPIQYEELSKRYNSLPKISFDYEVVEKAKHIVAVPFEGSWKDLGTWNTLTEEMNSQIIGRGILGEDCENTHLVNELDIPVAVMGISNAVVAVSPDGILVTDKIVSPKIKDLMKNEEQRTMYEERLWGWYRVLDYTKYDNGNEVLTRRIGINAGKNLSYQIHYKRSETWTILRGEAELVVNDKHRKVSEGEVITIPAGTKHGIKALTDLEFIEVQAGSELVEEDIVRIFMTWEEVERNCLMV